MALDSTLLDLIRCPENHTRLAPATDDVVAELNARIVKGGVKRVGGEVVDKPIEAGLAREDGAVLYPIVDGIPVLLIEQAIQL